MKERFYMYEQGIKNARTSLEKDKQVSAKNKELILRFEKQLLVEGLSKPRIIKYLYLLKMIAKNIKKDFDVLTKEDVQNYVAQINSTKYSEWTKQGYKIILKRFMKWLKGNNETYPEEVSWIKTKIAKNLQKMPNEGDLLTEEDIKKMINTAGNLRDKALISVLWESGARIGEIATIQIKDICFDKYGAQTTVEGKTGQRKIRLISSVPYISQWLSIHPAKGDRNAFVWVTIGKKDKNQLPCYALIRKTVRIIAKKSNINKKANPHSFRHARATFLANHLTEFQMNQYFGWVQGSNMPSTYVHLSGKNTDNALLRLNGIIQDQDRKISILKPINCPRCENVNASENKFCNRCGGVLDTKTALEIEQEQKKYQEAKLKSDSYLQVLLKDPELFSELIKKLTEIQLQKEIASVC